MDRRTFLRGVCGVGFTGAVGALLSACGTPAAAKRPPTIHRTKRTAGEVDALQYAEWVKEENARGDRTRAWIIPRYPTASPPSIEGYVDQVSYAAGDELQLKVNARVGSYRAFVYRIGYYGGFGARPVASSPELVGKVQPVPGPTPGTNTIECAWDTTWSIPVTRSWPPGMYLIKLNGSGGRDQYVPFVVRDDASHAAYLVNSSVTTWQAYNPYGGYSLYNGPPEVDQTTFDTRARVVSFDRPYSHSPNALDARGSGDFLGNEFPFVYLAERHGLDVTYVTDVDVHADPKRLLNHRAFVSLGHDEYWSMQMRHGVETALRSGVNLAFLGANACYRQIRLEDSASGASNRRVVCYKDAEADPIYLSDKSLATGGSWATDPVPMPESALIGTMYQSYGAPFGPLTVSDGSSWIFKGTRLRTGDQIPDLIGSEFDGFEPGYPYPDGVEILGHSPTTSVSGPRFSDLAYYSVRDGGGVFATGTGNWVPALWYAPGQISRRIGTGPRWQTYEPVIQITLNVLRAFGPGPASVRHPSTANWHQYYSPTDKVLSSEDVS